MVILHTGCKRHTHNIYYPLVVLLLFILILQASTANTLLSTSQQDDRGLSAARCRRVVDPPLDGKCNNIFRLILGAANLGMRLLKRRRGTSPVGASRRSAREISNIVLKKISSKQSNINMLNIFFGQLLDHTLIGANERPGDSSIGFEIPIPSDDPVFTSSKMDFARLPTRGTRRGRAPLNTVTSFVDASTVYGFSQAQLAHLRDGNTCKLRTSAGNLLPLEHGFFVAGEERSNENPFLTTMHTIFMREHNTICDELEEAFGEKSSEEKFQLARRILIGKLQYIAFCEYTGFIVGKSRFNCNDYKYNRRTDPTASAFFSSTVLRIGHSQLRDEFLVNGPNGKAETLQLKDLFFQPQNVLKFGIDNLVRNMLSSHAEEIDCQITDAVRNFLFPIGHGRIERDLAATNIQRGRDNALFSYNETRVQFGLPRVGFFDGKNSNSAGNLSVAYDGDIDEVDPWVGGVCELSVADSRLGELFTNAWVDEFNRLKNGDRFYFRSAGYFPSEVVEKIESVKDVANPVFTGSVFKSVILRNTALIEADFSPGNIFEV